MARKVNFDYERRQKEMRKQKKRQEKLEAKRARREAGRAADVEIVDASEIAGPVTDDERPSRPPKRT